MTRAYATRVGIGLTVFYWYQIFALDSVVVTCKAHKMFRSHGGVPNYCNVSSQRNNPIKLTQYDDTKKMAHGSQIVSDLPFARSKISKPSRYIDLELNNISLIIVSKRQHEVSLITKPTQICNKRINSQMGIIPTMYLYVLVHFIQTKNKLFIT